MKRKGKKVNWKKRYLALYRKYLKLADKNVELRQYKNAVTFYSGKMDY